MKIQDKIMEQLKKWFSDKREIQYIKVKSGTQTFYVNNPKKIKYYQNLSSRLTTRLLTQEVEVKPAVKILKVVYK